MTRAELEHVLRAAAAIADERQWMLVGSQCILGSIADPPQTLLFSMEIDLYPLQAPEKSILVDGSIGEGSMFHETFGYYAHGVGPDTAHLPPDWQARLVRLSIPEAEGFCLSPLDLATSKLAAGRPKDLDFVREMLRHAVVEAGPLQRLVVALNEPLCSLSWDILRLRTTL